MFCKRSKNFVPHYVFQVKLLGDVPQGDPVISLNQARELDNYRGLFPTRSSSCLPKSFTNQGSFPYSAGPKHQERIALALRLWEGNNASSYASYHLVYGPPQHVQQVGHVLLLPDKEVGAALG